VELLTRETKEERGKNMTLKITRFLTDAFNKQAKISHFASKIQVGTPDKINMSYINHIKS